LATSPLYPAAHKHAPIELVPTSEYEFAGHGLHCSTLTAPRMSWYVFAAQSTHAKLLVLFLYFPTGHSTHW
jgi:hypothetical protein